ncbi:hypothetical protein ACLFMI_05650 [Pseudonocardia nantongensis]|uniref:hypothetical protein n=1 Tax=Pseudonocardia nantongensis TaxID=1181885 RepID=UPI00397CD483
MTAATSAVPAGHELLLRLAGRFPDELLWRLRDWLASGTTGSADAVGAVLPRTLLRHRIGLDDDERALLAAVVGPGSPSRRLVAAVLPGSTTPEITFGAAEPDLGIWSARSVVAGHPGATGLQVATRGDGAQVVLVRCVATTAAPPAGLTAVLQRLLRVHGERTPRVEVLPGDVEPPAYHRDALAASTTVWTGSPALAGTAP